jgi:ribosomal protein S7
MRKRGSYKKNVLKGDFLHNRVDAARFINYLMADGQKATAEKVFYAALAEIEKATKEDAVAVFDKAILNASPLEQARLLAKQLISYAEFAEGETE